LPYRAEACLAELSGAHLDELARIRPLLGQFFDQDIGAKAEGHPTKNG
jgi:hypothetical protein